MKRANRLVAVLLLLVHLLLALTAGHFIDAVTNRSSSTAACTADECQLQVAKRMAAWMNRAVSPCDDFYEFACDNFSNVSDVGGGRVAAQALANEEIRSRLTDMFDSTEAPEHPNPKISRIYLFMRQFHEQCEEFQRVFSMQTEDQSDSIYKNFSTALLNQLEEEVLSYGGTPSAEGLLAALVKRGPAGRLTVELQSDALRDAAIYPEKVPLVPSMLVKERSYRLAFRRLVRETSNSGFHLSDGEFQELSLCVDDCIANNSAVQPCLEKKTDEIYTVNELDRITRCAFKNDLFSWNDFFGILFGQDGSGKRLVRVPDVSRSINLAMLVKNAIDTTGMKRLSDSRIVRYFVLDWLFDWSSRVAFARCMNQNSAKSVLSSMFYSRHFHPGSIQDVAGITDDLLKVSARRIQRSSRISTAGKVTMLRRLTDHLGYSIGFNEHSTSELKRLHEPLIEALQAIDAASEVTSANYFGQLLLASMKSGWFYNIESLLTGERNVSVFDSIDPFVTNAFIYSGEFEPSYHIVIPLGYMWPPFYQKELPRYVNLGSIGAIIAHEIGHVFHDQELIKLLNISDQVDCLLRRCSDLHGQLFSSDGAFERSATHRDTFKEDFSDTVSIGVAFKAAKSSLDAGSGASAMSDPVGLLGLTREQQFFVAAAQSLCSPVPSSPDNHATGSVTYSESSVRVNAQMMNCDEFSREFQCSPGSRMNPTEKCAFW